MVVKVGSSNLADEGRGLSGESLSFLARELVEVRLAGAQIVLVSSGAVAAGAGRLALSGRQMREKQALAAVGQGLLMQAYHQAFGDLGVTVAQILLTREDIEATERRENSRRTIQQLLRWGVLPIVNENDTVAVEEIRVGDNDTLSARAAVLLKADYLVLLTDQEGLFTTDPRQDRRARLVPTVSEVTSEMIQAAGGAGTDLGTGGMVTKLTAARIAQTGGVTTVIADGKRPGLLVDILQGGRPGTTFLPKLSQRG